MNIAISLFFGEKNNVAMRTLNKALHRMIESRNKIRRELYRFIVSRLVFLMSRCGKDER